MAVRKLKEKSKRPPAKTPEARENQLVSLAIDLAEKQLSEGTAGQQVITHYLKLASTQSRLEKEKLKTENELLKAKTEALRGQKKQEELFLRALDAMRSYSGGQSPGSPESMDDYDE